MDMPVHLFIAVPHANSENSAKEVEVLVAVNIEHILILGASHHQGFFVVVKDGWEQKFLVCEEDLLFRHRAWRSIRQTSTEARLAAVTRRRAPRLDTMLDADIINLNIWRRASPFSRRRHFIY